MKQEVKDLIIQYITETLNPAFGVSKKAVDTLECLLKEDREFAQELHTLFENLACANKVWCLYPNDWRTHGEVNHEYLEIYKEKHPGQEMIEPYDYGREGTK